LRGAHRTRNRIPHGRRAQSLGALEHSVSRLPQAPASPARPPRSPASFPLGSFGDCGRWPFELPHCNVRFARASFHRACRAHRLLLGLEISSWRAQRRTRRRVAQYYPNSAHALHFENMKALADVSALSPAPTSTEFIQRGRHVRPDSTLNCAKPYSSASSRPLLTRKTWPSGWRRCISRTLHGSSVGGMVTSNPAAMQTLCTASTSSTHTAIRSPWSAASSPSCVNVVVLEPLPRPPCAPWQRKMHTSPEPTAPKVGGVPQSHSFFQPHFSNHTNVPAISEMLRIGVIPLAFMC